MASNALPFLEKMKKMFPLGQLVFVLSIYFFGAAAFAEEIPTITVRKSDRISLNVSPISGNEGPAISRVLERDLDLSDWFFLKGKGRQASYVVSGEAAPGRFQGKVTDASGGNVLSKSYTGTPRVVAHLFADDVVQTLTGKKGIASKRVAFVSNRTGKKEIYLCDYDGGSVEQLSHDNALSVRPALNSDGTRLAYTGYQSGYADIYIVDLNTGARRRLVKFPGTNSGAAFSPDGNRIACTVSRDGKPEIYVVGSSDIGAYRRVTRTRGVAASPTWSPNGREIIYVGDESGGPQLYRISANGGTSGERISTGFGYCTEPSWSPDGRKVAFNVRTGGFSVAVKDLVKGETRVLANGENPTWGADSRHLIFSEGSSLILLDSQTGRRTNILSAFGRLSEPSWAQ
ncbi:MAG: biopolymer transporter Tol [Verrucomicrobia bacterium]|nr:MAG: biopolymer transporter Tol [Verrucomicrobiota bacterium]